MATRVMVCGPDVASEARQVKLTVEVVPLVGKTTDSEPSTYHSTEVSPSGSLTSARIVVWLLTKLPSAGERNVICPADADWLVLKVTVIVAALDALPLKSVATN